MQSPQDAIILPTIDVIIPVYNAYDDVVRCIESVRQCSPESCRIVLIDDQSTDERIAALFSDLDRTADSRVVLLKNPANLGFVGTVNRGMSLSENDVVLLNSDTIVTSSWLHKLRHCADSQQDIGTITPFSNNAEICSFPVFCHNNSLEGVDINVVNRALESTAAPTYPDIPTAVGFCMYIRRNLLNIIGLFDAETFGLGYGEENDFCMRAVRAGYRNVLCDDTFVAHLGSRSFDSKTEALKARNMQRLLAKHPDYLNIVQRFIEGDPLGSIRARAIVWLENLTAVRAMGVASVTVTFNPDPMRLAEQLVALRNQVSQIIIVDNGSAPSAKSICMQPEILGLIGKNTQISFLELQENHGLAHGFNIGVARSRERGAKFVLLLDQDSVPAHDMVRTLFAGFERAIEEKPGNTIAAVGPRVTDVRDAVSYPFVRLGWFRNKHVRCSNGKKSIVDCDFLISSGSLISAEAIDRVGGFDETLFIDSVDLEWCCRARAARLSLYGVCEAQLNHRLGDNRLAPLKRLNVIVHAPSRIYYMTRNRILLYRRPYVPLSWKIKDVLRMIAKFTALMLFVSPRLTYLKMTALAIRDGIANRGGRLRDDSV
jgi:L-rhamnosyltransferase